KLRDRLVDSLIGNEPRAYLRNRTRWNHRLGALADKTSADAMDLQRRPRPQPLEQRHLGLADQFLRAHFLLGVFLLVEWQPRPCLALFVTRWHHSVVESRNADLAVAILQGR